MLDEITCPACGRPNLAEAVKCWYCQEMLEKPKPSPKNELESEILTGGQGQVLPHEKPQPPLEEPESEMPEWLKRIRAMKAAEQEKEDERDRWQQQLLFNAAASRTARLSPQRKSKNRGSPPTSPIKTPESRPQSIQARTADSKDQPSPPQEELQAEPEDAGAEKHINEMPSGEITENLPDGFIPFERE